MNILSQKLKNGIKEGRMKRKKKREGEKYHVFLELYYKICSVSINKN